MFRATFELDKDGLDRIHPQARRPGGAERGTGMADVSGAALPALVSIVIATVSWMISPSRELPVGKRMDASMAGASDGASDDPAVEVAADGSDQRRRAVELWARAWFGMGS